MRNNADGIEAVYRIVFAPAITRRDTVLARTVSAKITKLRNRLKGASLSDIDADQLRTASEDLVLLLQRAAPVLGLERPSLSDLVQQWGWGRHPIARQGS